MTKVHFLRHIEEKRENAPWTYKTIGAYSTPEKAREALKRYRDLPGFRDYPERWRIFEIELDDDLDWREGFDSRTHEPLLKGAKQERL
ncbi:MAG TPA: hypothetical protein VFB13_08595 [Reyranella sp.]|jgi:hypothetical protein|nr:hypothetical protein [Reyranella sp.]